MKAWFGDWRSRFEAWIASLQHEADAHRDRLGPGRVDWNVLGVIALCCVCLTLQEYHGSSSDYHLLRWPASLFLDDPGAWIRETFRGGQRARLHRLFYWVGATTATYVLLPVLYIKLLLRQRIRDFGFSLRGALRHSWMYGLLYLLVLPAVVLVSFDPHFQRTYPFYEHASRSPYDFFAWELAYALQFLSLEFFFRGFLIQSLRPRFGLYALLVSVVPYCMIHFGKPMPETLGAILAGIALGLLALWTRSIWLGVAIHVSVAVTMDLLSLHNQGKLADLLGF